MFPVVTCFSPLNDVFGLARKPLNESASERERVSCFSPARHVMECLENGEFAYLVSLGRFTSSMACTVYELMGYTVYRRMALVQAIHSRESLAKQTVYMYVVVTVRFNCVDSPRNEGSHQFTTVWLGRNKGTIDIISAVTSCR
jgi:hypothetical protein